MWQWLWDKDDFPCAVSVMVAVMSELNLLTPLVRGQQCPLNATMLNKHPELPCISPEYQLPPVVKPGPLFSNLHVVKTRDQRLVAVLVHVATVHHTPPPHCRLLDDNRELFVPELQEVVRPHPHFMLFATQNPPGLYAGRKALSRAFRWVSTGGYC